MCNKSTSPSFHDVRGSISAIGAGLEMLKQKMDSHGEKDEILRYVAMIDKKIKCAREAWDKLRENIQDYVEQEHRDGK